MVDFFLALNTNIGSWIQNLERRDIMLLGSLAENIFGFTGAYARKKTSQLGPDPHGMETLGGIQYHD